MAKPNIKLNSRAIDALLKGPEVQKELRRRVGRAAAVAGPGFAASVTVGRSRALGRVTAETPEANRENARNHTLMRARDQMRG